MAEFLEERLPVSVRLGSSYSDEYAVDITQTRGGSEYRRLLNPYPVRRFSVNFTLAQAKLWANVINMYHRAYGMYAGFRVKCLDDYTTNAQVLPPTAFDEAMALVSTGVYQIQNYYGTGSTPISLGYPLRTIFKPVAGTVRVAGHRYFVCEALGHQEVALETIGSQILVRFRNMYFRELNLTTRTTLPFIYPISEIQGNLLPMS